MQSILQCCNKSQNHNSVYCFVLVRITTVKQFKITVHVNPCVKPQLKNRQNKDLNDKW